MNSCELTIAVSAAACAIANQLCDEDLELAAVLFTQLGDSLATIFMQRSRCGCGRPCCSNSKTDSE